MQPNVALAIRLVRQQPATVFVNAIRRQWLREDLGRNVHGGLRLALHGVAGPPLSVMATRLSGNSPASNRPRNMPHSRRRCCSSPATNASRSSRGARHSGLQHEKSGQHWPFSWSWCGQPSSHSESWRACELTQALRPRAARGIRMENPGARRTSRCEPSHARIAARPSLGRPGLGEPAHRIARAAPAARPEAIRPHS
jgi:hypothetical protein